MPIVAAEEMGGDWPTILRRLGDDASMVAQFQRGLRRRAAAVAAERRRRRSPPTCARWSRRRRASMPGSTATRSALRPAELRGFRLFIGKAGCVLCHVGWRFTDDRFHDIGLRGTRRRPRRRAGRHAGPDGVQDAEPARACPHGALHARRLAGDAGGGCRPLRRRLRRAAVAGDQPAPRPAPERRPRSADLVAFLQDAVEREKAPPARGGQGPTDAAGQSRGAQPAFSNLAISSASSW